MATDEDTAKAQRDLYWGMFVDLRTHARHAETMRANAVGLVLVLTSGLLAFIAADRTVNRADLPLALGVVLLAVFGLAFALLYTELFERNRKRAIVFRDALDQSNFSDQTLGLHKLLESAKTVEIRGEKKIGWPLMKMRNRIGSARWFWLVVPFLILIGGAILTFVAGSGPNGVQH